MNKETIIKNHCYTELVYQRINKKLATNYSKKEIEKIIITILKETNEEDYELRNKNFYVTNKNHNIEITINSGTNRIITVKKIVHSEGINFVKNHGKEAIKMRCKWCNNEKIYQDYHDTEWGVPKKDDQILFEMLILEGAQAGLSWITILKRRENYRLAFDNFDVKKVANYNEKKVERLLSDAGIIRNKLKINSAIKNARVFIEIQKEFGSFSEYIWQYVDNKPIINSYEKNEDLPTTSPLAKKISKDLKKRGMSFVGPVIIYSYMQSIGMINDHSSECFLSQKNLGKSIKAK